MADRPVRRRMWKPPRGRRLWPLGRRVRLTPPGEWWRPKRKSGSDEEGADG